MPQIASRFEDGDPAAHAKDWYGHVQAGRIGKPFTQTPEQAERHARNHRILTGGAK